MLKVFFDTDNIGMITDMLDAEEHSHYPIQLFLSIDEPLKITIAGKEVCAQCIAVGQNIPHTFSSQNRVHISAIIETASDFSRSLNERIDGAFAVFENAGLPTLQSKAKELIAASDKEQWQAFMRDFKLYLGIEPREQPLDERITELLSLLKKCDCYDHTIAAFAKQVSLSPSRLSHLFRDSLLKKCDCYDHTIAAFAKQVSLSPSRLSHLFREQVGVPLKSYIVLHQTEKAFAALLGGASITDAAMLAGFDSPSHFAATVKKLMGQPASKVTKDSEFLKVFL